MFYIYYAYKQGVYYHLTFCRIEHS